MRKESDVGTQRAQQVSRKRFSKKSLFLFVGVIISVFLFFQTVQAIPLAFTLDWLTLPNNAAGAYPYVETYTNIGGSGVDVTVTVPVQGQDEDYRDPDPGGDNVPMDYTGFDEVLRYYHQNGNGDVVPIVVNFSQPVVIDEILIGGNRLISSSIGALELRAYSGPDGTGSVVLPNPNVYPDPAVSADVTSPNPIPGTAPLNVIDGGANYAAQFVPARQSYVTLGFDAVYHWAVIDYEGAVVRSLVWEEYCTDDPDPDTARDNLFACQFNSAYLGGFAFDSNVDWGDLPDTFGTTNINGGASHLVDADLYLGSCVDIDGDGQPDAQAGGDDVASGTATGTCGAGGDEDGVALTTPLIPGEQACVAVTAVNSTGGPATLYGWMDFNGDGDFAGDANEALTFADASVANGGVSGQNYCFTVPAAATFDGGETHMRFRLSTDTGLSYGGFASDGEVEDYYQPLACVGNYVWIDTAGTTANVQDAGDAALSGVDVRLTWAGVDNTLQTAASDGTALGDDAVYTVTTDANGRYNFCGLIPDAADTYRVDIPTLPAAANQVVTANQGGNEVLDSDGTQGGAGQPVTGPTFTIGSPINLATGENGNQDNPGAINNFPDSQDDLRFDFGFQQTAVAIGNIVWADADDSGTLNGGETGINGVTVELFLDNGDMSCDPAVDTSQGTQVTAGGGFYNFLNVAPGNYCLAVVVDGTIIGPAGAYTLSSSGGNHNPDATGDHVATGGDDGVPNGANYVVSQVFTASVGGQSALSDTGDPAGYADNSAYMTVDFGFIASGPTAVSVQHTSAGSAQAAGLLSVLALGLSLGSWLTLRRKRTR